jgi:hypothetical protein
MSSMSSSPSPAFPSHSTSSTANPISEFEYNTLISYYHQEMMSIAADESTTYFQKMDKIAEIEKKIEYLQTIEKL